MSKTNKNRFQAGFTIVELVVAIAIGGLFIGAVATMLTNNARISERGRDLTVANSFAENKIEGLRSIGYLGLTDGTTNVSNDLPSELKQPRSASLIISSQTPSVKKAVISVTYSDHGSPRTYSYTTYVGELGVGQY